MPHNANMLYERAIEERRSGNLSQAREYISKAIEISPYNVDFRWLRMHLNYDGLYDLAIEDLDVLIDWYTGSDSDMYEVLLDRYAGTIAGIEPTLESDLQELLSKRAQCHNYLGQFDKVIDDLDQLIDTGDQPHTTYLWRGNLKFNLGRFEGAVEDFTTAHQMKPNYLLTLLKRAQAYFYLGAFDQALHDLDKILATATDSVDKFAAYLWRGGVHFSQGDYGTALADFHAYSELSGNEVFEDPETYVEKCLPDSYSDF